MVDTTGYRIRVGEREHRVEILAGGNGDPLRVSVDGHEFEVASAGAHTFRVGPRNADNQRQLEVVLADLLGRSSEAWLAGVRAKLEIRTEREARLEAALGRTSVAVSGEVVAPMPGRLVKVNVAVGDRVTRGAAVLIVEAMKMENELQAPISGVVQRLDVHEGDTVEVRQVLCVITPDV